jgi:CMP-N-acetylneuraminic acid synthetase/spore coat polysaccharide biosynthesis predicted glycosyltransferase SpsG
MISPESPSVLVVIPARGGSKGIPRKNLRSMRGLPLIAYAINTALRSSHDATVLISSEDDEILSVGEALGAIPHRRPLELAGDAIALDAVIYDAYRAAVDRFDQDFDIVVTVQPTSPLLRTATLDRAIEALQSDPDLDTVLTAVDDTHLRWSIREGVPKPDYEARLNRQYLPKTFKETGGAFATRAAVLGPMDRIGRTVSFVEVDAQEGIDIDGPEDWALCEWHLSRREILFVVTGNAEVGLGHAHNALAVADTLTRHHVRFLVDRGSELAAQVIRARNYEVAVQSREDLADEVDGLSPDLVINDRLDTTEEYVTALKRPGRLIVNFEDLGPGATHADLVINAIYPERELHPKHYFGPRYYCPRPEFVVSNAAAARGPVREVLVTFGGTDPNNLTGRVTRLIAPIARDAGIHVRVILGLGYHHEPRIESNPDMTVLTSVANMAVHMRNADIVFTSAGRTTFEVACVGTPAIVIAQNERELTHLFATNDHGFLNLGLAGEVQDGEIVRAFTRLVADASERQRMQERMTAVDLKGGQDRVRSLIEGLLGT